MRSFIRIPHIIICLSVVVLLGFFFFLFSSFSIFFFPGLCLHLCLFILFYLLMVLVSVELVILFFIQILIIFHLFIIHLLIYSYIHSFADYKLILHKGRKRRGRESLIKLLNEFLSSIYFLRVFGLINSPPSLKPPPDRLPLFPKPPIWVTSQKPRLFGNIDFFRNLLCTPIIM